MLEDAFAVDSGAVAAALGGDTAFGTDDGPGFTFVRALRSANAKYILAPSTHSNAQPCGRSSSRQSLSFVLELKK